MSSRLTWPEVRTAFRERERLRSAAENPNTAPSRLAGLAASEDETIRYTAANNRSTPHPALVLLAADINRDVAAAAAKMLAHHAAHPANKPQSGRP